MKFGVCVRVLSYICHVHFLIVRRYLLHRLYTLYCVFLCWSKLKRGSQHHLLPNLLFFLFFMHGAMEKKVYTPGNLETLNPFVYAITVTVWCTCGCMLMGVNLLAVGSGLSRGFLQGSSWPKNSTNSQGVKRKNGRGVRVGVVRCLSSHPTKYHWSGALSNRIQYAYLCKFINPFCFYLRTRGQRHCRVPMAVSAGSEPFGCR